jgi:hypothetical protein
MVAREVEAGLYWAIEVITLFFGLSHTPLEVISKRFKRSRMGFKTDEFRG